MPLLFEHSLSINHINCATFCSPEIKLHPLSLAAFLNNLQCNMQYSTIGNMSELRSVKTKLFCREGYYLEVSKDGKITPIKDQDHKDEMKLQKSFQSSQSKSLQSCCFYLLPVGLRVVAIQHCDTQLYISMDAEGFVSTSVNYTGECRFKETCIENKYVTYSSFKYRHPRKAENYKYKQPNETQREKTFRTMHLGINEKGKVKKGTRATKDRVGSHFLPYPIGIKILREPVNYDSGIGDWRDNERKELLLRKNETYMEV